MADDELERSEVEAVLETRRELGAAYDAELVASFAERIERVVEHRTAEVVSSRERHRSHDDGAGKRQVALGIMSLVGAVPISITLGVTDNLMALLVSWAGIVGVNVAHALQGRGPR